MIISDLSPLCALHNGHQAADRQPNLSVRKFLGRKRSWGDRYTTTRTRRLGGAGGI
jgi:hypothetical protein